MKVTVSPKTSTLNPGQTQQFSASVTGDAGNVGNDFRGEQTALNSSPRSFDGTISDPGPRPVDGTIRCGGWEGVVTWSKSEPRAERYDDGSGHVVSTLPGSVPVASPDGIQRHPAALHASQVVSPDGVTRIPNYPEGGGQFGRPTPQAPDSRTMASSGVGVTANAAVNWTASNGSIDANGLFTAPQSGGSATITATAVADSTQMDTALVTIEAVVAGIEGAAFVDTKRRVS